MLPFLLYLLAGILTAAHVYSLLSLGMLGVPHNVLELISLLGSFVLLVSAYISLYRPRLAAKLALLAALALWCFYGPAIAATVHVGRHHQVHAFRVVALPYLAVGLLSLATVYSLVVSAIKASEAGGQSWFFPEHATRSSRKAVALCSIAVIVGLSVWMISGNQSSRRPSSKFLIPDGYIGWVRVEFLVPNAPPLPFDHGRNVFKISPDGTLQTSSPESFGYGEDEYYYDSTQGRRKLPKEDGGGRLVWGQINGEDVGPGGRRQYEEFFVGTKQQFEEMAGTRKSPKPVADPAHLDKSR